MSHIKTLVSSVVFVFFTIPSAWGQAVSTQIDPFLVQSTLVQELKLLHAPSNFIELALVDLNAIVFKALPEGVGAAFDPRSRTIYLDFSMRDPSTGTLKKVNLLSEDQIATLYHEFFHAYFNMISRLQADHLYRTWYKNTSIYPSRGQEIHEEAYAVFVETTMTQYIRIRRLMALKTPEQRKKLAASPNFVMTYESIFSTPVYGYYYDTWTQRFIQSNINLPEDDRLNILKQLYFDELSTIFSEVFAEDKFP